MMRAAAVPERVVAGGGTAARRRANFRYRADLVGHPTRSHQCVQEPLIAFSARAASLASSCSAALSSSELGSTTISDDGLT